MKEVIKKRFKKIYEYYLSLLRDYRYKNLINMTHDQWVEDTLINYKKIIGAELDFNNLQRYSAKIQFQKLFNNSELKTNLSDKYEVRSWVESKIGDEYLIPLLGVWDSFDDINFDELPDTFVLKTNHGSSTNLIVKDKIKINYEKEKKKFDKWLNTNYAFVNGVQLQYKNIEPKIIAEKYIEDSNGELKDYRILCFSGKPEYIIVDSENHKYRDIYDLDWEHQNWLLGDYENNPRSLKKPENLRELVRIATNLSEGFSHVRVDLYSVDEKIFFSEMTFSFASGFQKFKPDSADIELGKLWNISNTFQE
ncbi:ATP-grasp fold amidoligase family protein [Globicatella sanguinis]